MKWPQIFLLLIGKLLRNIYSSTRDGVHLKDEIYQAIYSPIIITNGSLKNVAKSSSGSGWSNAGFPNQYMPEINKTRRIEIPDLSMTRKQRGNQSIGWWFKNCMDWDFWWMDDPAASFYWLFKWVSFNPDCLWTAPWWRGAGITWIFLCAMILFNHFAFLWW